MPGPVDTRHGKIAPRLLLLLIFLLGTALILLSLFPDRLLPGKNPPAPSSSQTSARLSPPSTLASPPPQTTYLPIASEAASTLASPGGTAEDDLSTIELLLTEYSRHHHGNPVGENIEITASLLGKNPRRLAYLENRGPYLDTASRLIDRWGTPYFFHQLSATRTELRSAGPDREFHTPDDIVR